MSDETDLLNAYRGQLAKIRAAWKQAHGYLDLEEGKYIGNDGDPHRMRHHLVEAFKATHEAIIDTSVDELEEIS